MKRPIGLFYRAQVKWFREKVSWKFSSEILNSDCFNKTDESLPRPKQITRKVRHDPGSISDWCPGPAYVAENDPVQNSVVLDSPTLRERKTVSFIV